MADIPAPPAPKRQRLAPRSNEEQEQQSERVERAQPVQRVQRERLYSSVLSSGDDESDDSSCSDDYASDSFCSDNLESDGSSGEEPDAYVSDEEDKEVEEPFWEHDEEKRCPVWQIDDVRTSSEGVKEVSVLWDWRPTKNSRRYRRWEPAELMMETHPEEVKLAERFKASGMRHFQQFCKTDEYGKRIIDASDDYNCLFRGLEIGAHVIGRPDLIPDEVVKKFLEDELKEGRDLLLGCTWKQFAKLLPRLRAARCDLVINYLQKNLATGGRRGTKYLATEPFDDGLYLVGAYNRHYYGHCVILSVSEAGTKRSIIDEGKSGRIRETTVQEQKWIVFFAFVHPFRVFKPRV